MSGQASVGTGVEMPLPFMRRFQSTSSETPTRTFFGSQPRKLQVPPKGSESTTVTLQPAFRQVSATLCAAAPEPRTMRSTVMIRGSSRRAEALCADGGRLVTEVYEQIGSLLDKRRRTADEDARPSHRRGADRSQHLGVDSPCESAPVRRRLAREGVVHADTVCRVCPLELVAIEHVVDRADGQEQPRLDCAHPRGAMAEDGHQRNQARAAGDRQERTPVLHAPDEVAGERPPQLERVADAQHLGQVRRDLAVFEPLHSQLRHRFLGRRGDREKALCLIPVLGRKADVDVVAGDVPRPTGHVEHDGLRARGWGFGAGVADGRDVPADRGTTRPVRPDAIHEEAGPLAVPSPHGRSRMIVFPLIRSVGLKAATASSRVAIWPMFVRSRPSRTRWAISLSWARSDTTTKSIARPSAGRASGGPAMVTSVPPARTRPADRFPMSPPITSKTRSTSPTSSRASLSRSTNSAAPKSSAFWRSAVRPVPMTYAPASRASCVTIVPTAPAAPCARTLCPAWSRPCSNSPCHAVRPEIGRLAPTVKSTSPGSGARLRASTATYSARVPSRVQSARPNTRWPTDSPVVP